MIISQTETLICCRMLTQVGLAFEVGQCDKDGKGTVLSLPFYSPKWRQRLGFVDIPLANRAGLIDKVKEMKELARRRGLGWNVIVK